MPDALRLDTANLVGLVMQAVCFGIFQVLFFACIYVLVSCRNTESINYHFLITACLMWVLIGANFALSWSRVLDALIVLQPELRNDPLAIDKYFGNLSHWKEVSRTACYVALTAVADSLFIYRCYIVWGRNPYIIVLPILLLCGSITSGIGIEVVISSGTDLFASSLASWAMSFFSISLVQNVITTFFIVFRIWRVNMNVSKIGGSRSLWPVMAVLLESGAIYSSTLFVLLMTYVSGSFSQYIALDMLVPIIGIVFNLIIVRVGLGISQSPSGPQGSTTTREHPAAVRLQKLNINVSRQITVDHDSTRVGPQSGLDMKDDNSDDQQWKPVGVMAV